jgi:hypothetical protein
MKEKRNEQGTITVPIEDGRMLFALGQLVATPAALAAVPAHRISEALRAHVTGDFGEMEQEDLEANRRAVQTGSERVFSSYRYIDSDGSQEKFWIITEADRSVTTVLLPDDY